MDAELKAKWIAALRSGEYEQARNVLFNRGTGGMCCIGVLAHIQGAPIEKWEHFELETSTLTTRYSGGLDPDLMRALAGKNDEGDSFAEIADYIERNL